MLEYIEENDEESSTSPIIALKRMNPAIPLNATYVNPNTRFRIWDFFGRCHINFHTTNPIFPIGIPAGSPNEQVYFPGVSLYVKPGFDWTTLISPSVADFDQKDFNESTIDRFFHQFVEVLHLGIDDINPNEDDMNLNEPNFIGHFECVNQCRKRSPTSDLALINSDLCYCTTYQTIPSVLQISKFPYHQCRDNTSMSCGDGSTTVYHLNPDFGSESNFGYQFWQAIQIPTFYNYKTIMSNSDIPYKSNTTYSANRCLSFCKEDDFEIAIISKTGINANDTFECFCMYPEFYKFTWQDISKEGLEGWCPDLVGPCVPFDDEKKYAVVYCMDEACDVDMILDPTNQELCEIGIKIADPKDGLSNHYFECTKNDSIHSTFMRKSCENPDHLFFPNVGFCAEPNCAIGDHIAIENCTNTYAECERDSQSGENVWNPTECPEGLLYSPKKKTCTQYCDGESQALQSRDCKRQSNESHCKCQDEWFGVKVFWEVERGQTGQMPCSMYTQKGRNFVGGSYNFLFCHI